MKKVFVSSVIFLCLLSIPLFSQETQKITYFKFVQQDVPVEFQFLADSLPNSIRSVLSRNGYQTVDRQGKIIEDVYNRTEIVKTGKELGTDLVLTGKYYISGEGSKRQINLIIFVYDVKGEERVIEKLVIGGTGAAMFELVDSVGLLVEREVAAYYKKREEMLAQARKKREEAEARDAETRRREQENALRQNAVHTLYNSSMYLDSHVTPVKSMKVFYYMLVNADKNDNIPNSGTSSTIKSLSYLSQINLAYGIFDGLEFKLEIPFQFKSSFNIYDDVTSTDLGRSIGFKFYNPIFGFKYRLLKDEKQGLNLTLEFSMQFALSKENSLFGDIFIQPIITDSYHFSVPQHRFIFGVYLDKTMGIFTPFISFKLSLKKYLNSISLYGVYADATFNYQMEWDTKTGVDLKITVGTEIRPLYWLIIQPYYYFYYVSKASGISEGAIAILLDSYHIHTIGANFIFKVKPELSLAIAFNYNIKSDIFTKFNSFETNNQSKYSFTIYFYAAALINF